MVTSSGQDGELLVDYQKKVVIWYGESEPRWDPVYRRVLLKVVGTIKSEEEPQKYNPNYECLSLVKLNDHAPEILYGFQYFWKTYTVDSIQFEGDLVKEQLSVHASYGYHSYCEHVEDTRTETEFLMQVPNLN